MPIRAIAYLLLAMMMFAVQDALFKQLTQDYAVLQLLFLRMTLVVCILSVVYAVRRKVLTLKTTHKPLMMFRGAIAFIAFFLYYMALQRAGFAEAATVLMSAPLFVTALSVPLLGEHVGVHRWSAVCIGFLAVILMLRPGTGLFQPIMLLPLASAIIYSLLPIIARILPEQISAFTITFYTTVSYWIMCAIGAVVVHWHPASAQSSAVYQAIAQPWVAITGIAPALLVLSGFLFVLSIFLVTLAYRQAQVSAITSFEYVYLVWAVIIGYVVFDEVPSLLTYFAALVIIGCGFYIAWREHQTNQDTVDTKVIPSIHN